jgi:hypothetical protein
MNRHPIPGRWAALRAGLALCASAFWLAGCENNVQPEPTSGELIREILVTGADESILFSSQVLRDQTGTVSYARTIDSIHRGFVNYRFYAETVEDPGALAFEADILDTLWGTVTLNVNGTYVSHPYVKAAYGGNAKLLDNYCITCENPWRIWRMRYRKADQPNGAGEPKITSMSVTNSAGGYAIVASPQVRIFRDSVATVPLDSVTSLTVRVVTDAPDDTFFITYPLAGGYQTVAMSHNLVDSLGHNAVVGVSSLRRFELLAVQGFKRQALQDTLYNQAASSAMQTAIIAFR